MLYFYFQVSNMDMYTIDQSSSIRKATLIEARVKGKISKTQLSEVFASHSIENVPDTETIADCQDMPNTKRDKVLNSTSSPSNAYVVLERKYLDFTETDQDDLEPYTLCILIWEKLSEPVDYFLIYSYDEKQKYLLGHTVLNTFVWKKPECKTYSYFSIQPHFTI